MRHGFDLDADMVRVLSTAANGPLRREVCVTRRVGADWHADSDVCFALERLGALRFLHTLPDLDQLPTQWTRSWALTQFGLELLQATLASQPCEGTGL
jgi:hypothetical protein